MNHLGSNAGPPFHGADNAHGQAHGAQHQRVPHGPIGRKPRRDVAARDTVEAAIGRRKKVHRVRHPFAEGGNTPDAYNAMSVPIESTIRVSMPASTAPML